MGVVVPTINLILVERRYWWRLEGFYSFFIISSLIYTERETFRNSNPAIHLLNVIIFFYIHFQIKILLNSFCKRLNLMHRDTLHSRQDNTLNKMWQH